MIFQKFEELKKYISEVIPKQFIEQCSDLVKSMIQSRNYNDPPKN